MKSLIIFFFRFVNKLAFLSFCSTCFYDKLQIIFLCSRENLFIFYLLNKMWNSRDICMFQATVWLLEIECKNVVVFLSFFIYLSIKKSKEIHKEKTILNFFKFLFLSFQINFNFVKLTLTKRVCFQWWCWWWWNLAPDAFGNHFIIQKFRWRKKKY